MGKPATDVIEVDLRDVFEVNDTFINFLQDAFDASLTNGEVWTDWDCKPNYLKNDDHWVVGFRVNGVVEEF